MKQKCLKLTSTSEKQQQNEKSETLQIQVVKSNINIVSLSQSQINVTVINQHGQGLTAYFESSESIKSLEQLGNDNPTTFKVVIIILKTEVRRA